MYFEMTNFYFRHLQDQLEKLLFLIFQVLRYIEITFYVIKQESKNVIYIPAPGGMGAL